MVVTVPFETLFFIWFNFFTTKTLPLVLSWFHSSPWIPLLFLESEREQKKTYAMVHILHLFWWWWRWRQIHSKFEFKRRNEREREWKSKKILRNADVPTEKKNRQTNTRAALFRKRHTRNQCLYNESSNDGNKFNASKTHQQQQQPNAKQKGLWSLVILIKSNDFFDIFALFSGVRFFCAPNFIVFVNVVVMLFSSNQVRIGYCVLKVMIIYEIDFPRCWPTTFRRNRPRKAVSKRLETLHRTKDTKNSHTTRRHFGK